MKRRGSAYLKAAVLVAMGATPEAAAVRLAAHHGALRSAIENEGRLAK